MEILKLLKKYMLGIIIIVVLLVVQAKCDLALPEYTSNIINVGIQQKGIESPIPNYISEELLDIITTISGNKKIKEMFEPMSNSNKDRLNIKEENVYELKDKVVDRVVEEDIATAISFYYMLVSNPELKNKGFNIDYTTLNYYMKAEENNEIKTMYQEVKKTDQELLNQYAITYISKEYEELGINLEKLQMSYLFNVGIKMIILSLFIMVIIVISTYLSGRIASSFAYDLRNKVVNKVMSYSNEEFNEFKTSSLITRTTNDVSQIQMIFVMALRMILYAPIIGIGALIKVSNIDMVWIVGYSLAAVLILMIFLLIFALPKFKIVQKLIDRINLVVREILNGLPVIRAFANEEKEKEKFREANYNLMKVNLFTQRLMALMNPLMTLIMNGTIVLIYWIGAENINSGTIQVGTLTALITYTMHIIMSFLMLSMLSIIAPRAIISINRVKEVLNKKTSIQNPKVSKRFITDQIGVVEFKNVSFKYPDGDELVLDDISFKINKGETLAIIGSTGSGKSTIVNLIPRFFDITSGTILVNGVDVRELNLKELRNEIGIVPQKGILFSGTISSNVKFANPNITDEEMIKACEIACAKKFIEEKEEKYNYEIAEGGTNVSGGQRQRLAIARAIAKNPNIYIFDDSFSALDYKTDSQVRKNLSDNCKNATKIIVAQRVATVMNADQIIVLDKGKIVGKGTHKELYKNCKIYKEIALSQLKEEELV